MMGGHQQFLCQSLLCLLNKSSRVDAPGQVLFHVNVQKWKNWDPLHIVTYEKGLMSVLFFLSSIISTLVLVVRTRLFLSATQIAPPPHPSKLDDTVVGLDVACSLKYIGWKIGDWGWCQYWGWWYVGANSCSLAVIWQRDLNPPKNCMFDGPSQVWWFGNQSVSRDGTERGPEVCKTEA